MSQQQPNPADGSMTTARAAVVREVNGPYNIEELELDELRPNEVRVRVVAVGVCHTDVAMRDGVYPIPMPVVLGHEGGGIVEAVGSNVTRVSVGDHVVMTVNYDGRCQQCLTGHMAYCENGFAENFGGRRTLDGTTSLKSSSGEVVSSHFFGQSSFSTYANVVENSLVPVDRDLPLEQIAFFGCGMQTGAGAILNELRPPAGSSVAIAGTGAVGHAAVMAAHASGCATIIAIDLHDNRVGLAQEVGATHGIHGRSEDAIEELLRITGGRGVDYILDTTGSVDSLAAMAGALAIRGTLADVAAVSPGTTASFEVGGSILKGWTFKTIVQGSSVPQVFIPRLIELWKQGRFPADKLVKTYTFDDINSAFADSESGATVKPVIVF
jgi:aryl-alcohol dehydrogenase